MGRVEGLAGLRKEQVEEGRKVLVFHCNWAGQSALEEVGRQGESYSCQVLPVRVPCVGRLHAGMVLRALELGAAGVLMVGCLEGQCRFGAGDHKVAEVYQEASSLARLLGFGEGQIRLERVGPHDHEKMIRLVEGFLHEVTRGEVARAQPAEQPRSGGKAAKP